MSDRTEPHPQPKRRLLVRSATQSLVAATAGALFARAGEVHGQAATIQARSVQRIHGILRLLRRAHRDKPKTSGAAAGAVHHQVGLQHGAMTGKCILQIVLGGVEGKISDK